MKLSRQQRIRAAIDELPINGTINYALYPKEIQRLNEEKNVIAIPLPQHVNSHGLTLCRITKLK